MKQTFTAPATSQYWRPHTQHWIVMRPTFPADGCVWVYWEKTTPRKQVPLSIVQQTTVLQATEEASYLGSYEADLATSSLRLLDGIFRLFGEKPQDFPSTLASIDARSHPDDTRMVQETIDQAVADRKPYTYLRSI